MRIILFTFLAFVLFAQNTISQDFTALFPVGFSNKSLNLVDTLDGLFMNGEVFELTPTQVKVDSVYNPAHEATVHQYKIMSNNKPIVLFKNHNFQKSDIPGKHFDLKFLMPFETITYALADNTFNLRAYGEMTDHGNYRTIENYKIYLEWQNYKEILRYELIYVKSVQVTSDEFIEGPKIIWIGDLNNDQKIDLILEEGCHYAQIKRGIYLSSDLNEKTYPRTVLVLGSID